MTESGSKILVCCFSVNDEIFDGKGEFYGPDTDTTTFVLSEDDIRETFKDNFNIEKLEELEYGKLSKFKVSGNKKRHLVFMMRK
ncbi:MAG: hypothetical protein WCK16_05420 [Candidatus Moraniibacteriota bacterium]